MKKILKWLFIAFGAIILIGIVGVAFDNTLPAKANKETPAIIANSPPAKPPENNYVDSMLNLIKTWKETNISAWDGSCKPVEDYLKRQMNDPDSYEHIETSYSINTLQDAMDVTTKFRAKNAYGAKVISQATATVNLDGSVKEFQLK